MVNDASKSSVTNRRVRQLMDELDQQLRDQGVRAWQSGDRAEIERVQRWLKKFDKSRERLLELVGEGAFDQGPQDVPEPVLEQTEEALPLPVHKEVPPRIVEEPEIPIPQVPIKQELVADALTPSEPASTMSAKQREAAGRRRTRQIEKDIQAATKVLDDLQDLADPWVRRRKLCLLRELYEAAKGSDNDYPVLDQWWDQLKDAFEGDEFFGFNRQKRLPVDVWRDLALAFEAGGHAETWARSASQPLGEEGGQLHECATAVRDFLELMIEQVVCIPADSAVKSLREALLPLGSERGATLPSDLKKARERLRKMANDFLTCYERYVVNRNKRDRRETARATLADLIDNSFASATFAQDLASAAVACLEAGVPPSDKALRSTLVPFYHQLNHAMPIAGKRLLEYLARDEATVAAEQLLADLHEDFAAEDADVNDEHEQRVEELKELLSGKTVLFVGGNKGQELRRLELSELLGANLVWPDLEEDTKISRIKHLTKDADLVVLLIRFCRHNYKDVLDHAAKLGKRVATLKAGLGVRRVVYDLHVKLCRSG